jgi:hypothetical protein
MKGMQPTHRSIVLLLLGLAACAGKDRDDGNVPSAPPSNVTTADASVPAVDATVTGSQLDAALGAAACPGARPAEGTTCRVSASLCAYDEIECRCPTGVWSCEEPVNPNCPPQTPVFGSTCSLPEATECDYLDQECECLSGVWMCQSEDEDDAAAGADGGARTDAGADAGRDGGADAGACPQGRPAERTTCASSSQTCTYESTQCVCPSGLWSCTEPVDMGCPATAPLHGDRCAGRADCDFLEVECECLRGAWSCKPND